MCVADSMDKSNGMLKTVSKSAHCMSHYVNAGWLYFRYIIAFSLLRSYFNT